MAITAVHTLIYSDDAAATRAFLKDVLRWPFVPDSSGSDDPNSWLIFGTGRSEMGVHPTSGEGGWSSSSHHEISLMCDDLDATVEELRSRGAEFSGDVQDMGFGRGIMLAVPGADDMLLYQAHHAPAHHLDG
ncbi:MAG: VOC family protein [Mobilicoccus sp.]|nr:VOC family protein [Mobilicoccus sp.]